ncbi:MAG: hypothetical protein D6807_08615 [Alphaproteobacteria bacterium]|nr:MAG: hypothetical protein D6807_08615 [Alphaproteobacteria bacterium]
MDIRRTPKARRRVTERVRANKCLYVDSDGKECDEPIVTLGLCSGHAVKTLRELKRESPKVAELSRAELIRQGRMLARGEQRRLMRPSPIALVIERVRRDVSA